ncbi:hypothetical protein BJ508DRAFT_336809 [Ascobolus immersus RN42]|uniref:Uncharacterized protein n=1 Tax=Ascobolus immersus RN42 TaxID=1160509 RepID=A0A3N4H7A2_ASCIM|nr:hypothetical protein BJ508DRAFT_336809 [Ascobolus immersus RN42]
MQQQGPENMYKHNRKRARLTTPGEDGPEFEMDMTMSDESVGPSDSEDSYFESAQDTSDLFPFRDAGVQVDMPIAGVYAFATGSGKDSPAADPEEMAMSGNGSAIFSFNDPDLEGHAVKFPREDRTHTYECVALRMKGNNEMGVCLETKVSRVDCDGNSIVRTARAGWIGCGQPTFDILRLLDHGFVVYADVTWVKKYFWYRVDSDCWDGMVRWRAYPSEVDAETNHQTLEFSDWEDGSVPEPDYYSDN